jgi:hypothetical protein
MKKHIPKNTSVRFKYINIGPVMSWGRPIFKLLKFPWPKYSKSIHSLADKPELILIDGRFRVACAIQTILFCVKNQLKPRILLHDCVREEYSVLYEILDPIKMIPTSHQDKYGLQLFAIKENNDIPALRNLYKLYKYDYS